MPANFCEALVIRHGVVLRHPAGAAGFFVLLTIASLNSLISTGETRRTEMCKLQIAFIKANSYCLSMMFRIGHSEKSSCPSSV